MTNLQFEVIHAMGGFNCLSCYLNPDISDYEKVTEKDIIQKLIVESSGVKSYITDVYAILNMSPFPYKEITWCTERLIYDEKKDRWVDDDPELCHKWLENIYNMIEEESFKQGKLDKNYKKQSWFLIYKDPPQHLRNFLTFIIPKILELGEECAEGAASLKQRSIYQEMLDEPEKFISPFKEFIESIDKAALHYIVDESQYVLSMDPFPREWFFITLHSAAVYESSKSYDRRKRLCLLDGHTLLFHIITQLKQEALKQGKL